MTTPLVLAGFGAPIYVERELLFHEPVNRQALAYWQAKAAQRGMPARSDLDPIEMRAFVTNVALVDVLAAETPQTFRIRLAGTAVEEVFGHLTGKKLTELPEYFAARWQGLFQAATDARTPVRVTTRVTLERKEHLTAEALLAPLSEDRSSISMLFVSVGFWTDIRPPQPAG